MMNLAKQIAHRSDGKDDKVKVMTRRKVKEPHEPEEKPVEKVIKEVVKPRPAAKKKDVVLPASTPVESSAPVPVLAPAPEVSEKPKRKRAPLTPEQKEKAVANLKLARERKAAKKLQ